MLTRFLDDFKNKKIIVIGDIMLDKYIWGDVTRISPEAPVPVVKAIKDEYMPGGASNVANNIASLGAKAYMVGFTGNDIAHPILVAELKRRNIDTSGIIQDKKRPTIQKIRVMGQKQQLLRIDYEDTKEFTEHEENILSFISQKIKEIDMIIVSDYAKGVVTSSMMGKLKELCKRHDKHIIVDPKPRNLQYYNKVHLITPNLKEASQMLKAYGNSEDDTGKLGKGLISATGSSILITKGEKGMSLYEKDGSVKNIPTKAKEVFDVTGAGDTVVAALALALSSGADLKQAAEIANHAAGIVVAKLGTSTATIEELKESIEDE